MTLPALVDVVSAHEPLRLSGLAEKDDHDLGTATGAVKAQRV